MRVLLLGRLADIAGWRERVIEPAPARLSALTALLGEDDANLGEALAGRGVRVAIDKALTRGDPALKADAEVAYLPAMSGG